MLTFRRRGQRKKNPELAQSCRVSYFRRVKNYRPRKRSVLLSFRFLTTSIAGSLVMSLIYVFGTIEAQLAALGTMVSILAGILISFIEQQSENERMREELLARLQVPISLLRHPQLFQSYSGLSDRLTQIAAQDDDVLREFALLKLSSIDNQLALLSRGEIIFSSTESWRTVYEQLLQSSEIGCYRSIAWVKSSTYWQDVPGQKSMELNFRLIQDGLVIQRLVIIRDSIWPISGPLEGEILTWLEQQHASGIQVSLIRESSLVSEPDLKVDCGIYGDRAVGIQELDEDSRTIRFSLQFDPTVVRLFEDRWARLQLYSEPFSKVVVA